MQFDKPLDEEQKEMVDEIFGDELVAMDEKSALFEGNTFFQKEISKLANKLKQPVALEMNDIGDKKTVNGVEYLLTEDGWKAQ